MNRFYTPQLLAYLCINRQICFCVLTCDPFGVFKQETTDMQQMALLGALAGVAIASTSKLTQITGSTTPRPWTT